MKTVRVPFAVVLCFLVTAGCAVAGEKTQSFPVKKGDALEVRVDAGDITIRGWEKSEVFVRVQSFSEDQLREVTMSQSGGKVLVEFDWKERNVKDMHFEINVPSSFDVDLQTAGGELALHAPLTGNLKGSTAGGEITMGNIGGTIRMETAGGEISSGDINGDLTCRTAGGDITLQNISGSAEVSTAGGDIQVGTVTKTLRASTAGGSVKIERAGGELSVSTAGGNISVGSGQGDVSLNTAGGNVKLKSAHGRVSAGTSGGNVELADIQGAVSARTSAGNIEVTLDPAVNESSTLATSAGNIVLIIPSSARATIHARSRGPFNGRGDGDRSAISSDFPMKQPGKSRTGDEAEIVLNGGGHRIALETMIGTISVKKKEK
jgi:DUF4097 and DUF4098 domain-containing protein YvlB